MSRVRRNTIGLNKVSLGIVARRRDFDPMMMLINFDDFKILFSWEHVIKWGRSVR